MPGDAPNNQVLTAINPTGDPTKVYTPPTSRSAEYPRCVYHRDSKPGELIAKLVENADQLKELGDEWGSLADLQIETAPAEKVE